MDVVPRATRETLLALLMLFAAWVSVVARIRRPIEVAAVDTLALEKLAELQRSYYSEVIGWEEVLIQRMRRIER